jgi:nitrate/nitrite transporter NarK
MVGLDRAHRGRHDRRGRYEEVLVNTQWPYGLVLLGILAGAGVLGLAAVTLAIPRLFEASGYRGGRRPRLGPGEEEQATALLGPDSVLEGFAGGVEEAGVGMPVFMWVTVVAVPIWVIVYLILFWMNDA